MVSKGQTAGVVEIEVDGPLNECLRFPPIDKRVRGRWLWSRCKNPEAMRAAVDWPEGAIPGQVIGVDLDRGCGYVRERLHEDEFTVIREAIERKGAGIPPEMEETAGVYLPTWLYWMRRAVDGGLAVVIAGELPEAAELLKQKPRLDFFRREVPNAKDKTIERLLGILARTVGEDETAKLLAAEAAE